MKKKYLRTNATVKTGTQTSEASQECKNGGRPTGKGQNLSTSELLWNLFFCILLI